MILALVLASSVTCSVSWLTEQQAGALVLASPNIRQAMIERGAKPFFDGVMAGPHGWSFDVNSRTPCPTTNPCSSLLGHFAVSRETGAVEDLDTHGGAGTVVSSAQIEKLRDRFLQRRCSA